MRKNNIGFTKNSKNIYSFIKFYMTVKINNIKNQIFF